MDAMAAFLSPLGGVRRLAPVQVQSASAPRSVPAAVSIAPVRSASNASIATSAVGSLVALASCARLAKGAKRRQVRRQSRRQGKSELPAPRYPGPDDPAEMREFAAQLMNFYREGGLLPITDLLDLLKDAELFLSDQKPLVHIEVPKGQYLNVVGDVHGQLFDFLSIFEENGLPSEENPYLFNGDFVDRGSYSVEIMVLLLAWKLAFPQHVHLARGNHEDADMNFAYGFTGEVLAKYKAQLAVWTSFQRVFLRLPLSHVINNDVFVTHGGLPRKEGTRLEDIESLDVIEIIKDLEQRKQHRDYELMSDLMWSDPRNIQGIQTGDRGPSTVVFGADVTQRFLERNSLSFMIRSHEVKDEGYEWQHGKRCLTVFSAPQYCDSCNNKGAVVRLHAQESGKLEPDIRQFVSAAKPAHYVQCMEFTRPGLTEQLWTLALQQAGVK